MRTCHLWVGSVRLFTALIWWFAVVPPGGGVVYYEYITYDRCKVYHDRYVTIPTLQVSDCRWKDDHGN